MADDYQAELTRLEKAAAAALDELSGPLPERSDALTDSHANVDLLGQVGDLFSHHATRFAVTSQSGVGEAVRDSVAQLCLHCKVLTTMTRTVASLSVQSRQTDLLTGARKTLRALLAVIQAVRTCDRNDKSLPNQEMGKLFESVKSLKAVAPNNVTSTWKALTKLIALLRDAQSEMHQTIREADSSQQEADSVEQMRNSLRALGISVQLVKHVILFVQKLRNAENPVEAQVEWQDAVLASARALSPAVDDTVAAWDDEDVDAARESTRSVVAAARVLLNTLADSEYWLQRPLTGKTSSHEAWQRLLNDILDEVHERSLSVGL